MIIRSGRGNTTAGEARTLAALITGQDPENVSCYMLVVGMKGHDERCKEAYIINTDIEDYDNAIKVLVRASSELMYAGAEDTILGEDDEDDF